MKHIYKRVYIYTLSLSDDRFHKDVKPRYFLKNYDNYRQFKITESLLHFIQTSRFHTSSLRTDSK